MSNWGAIGGPRGVTTVDKWAIDNPEDPHAHLRRYPADGTLISNNDDGRVYVVAGGAPTYLSNWNEIGGPRPSTTVDKWAIDNPEDPHAHLRRHPADGALVSNTRDGRVYVIAGGAPLYVSNWGAIGGPRGVTTIDRWAIDNPQDPHAHLLAYPADGTFVTTSTGRVYRIAGGVPFYVSTWSIFGGVLGSTLIDQWAVDTTEHPAAHLRATPLDGTLVQGLPSGQYWTFAGGLRSAAPASAGAVDVDDVGLAAFALLPASPAAAGAPSSIASPAAGGVVSRRSLARCRSLPARAARIRCVTAVRQRRRLARGLERCRIRHTAVARSRCRATVRHRFASRH